MLTLSKSDWTKILNNKIAIRMAPSHNDLNGHAYGLFETAPDAKRGILDLLSYSNAVPADWYDKLFNTMSHIVSFALDKDATCPWFLLFISGQNRADNHLFPVRSGLKRGDGNSFPRVNLTLKNTNPTVFSYYFMEDLNKQMLTDANKLEDFCDFVIHRIKNTNIS